MICFGDFNDVFADSQKSGDNPRTYNQFSWGRQSLDLCRLVDLGFEGYPFTWKNGR